MQEEYYLNKLYPLQDRIFELIDSGICESFYLTGGTALSRFYFQHRFSDDLDFFTNRSENFLHDITSFEMRLQQAALPFSVTTSSESFRRIIIDNDAQLKVDFVNDVGFRFGENVVFQNFSRVDNLRNILSNKLTALERKELKDIVDILYLCRNLSFHWEEIFEDALKKVVFIDPIDVSAYLHSCSLDSFHKLNWFHQPDSKQAEEDIRSISVDVLKKARNSLVI